MDSYYTLECITGPYGDTCFRTVSIGNMKSTKTGALCTAAALFSVTGDNKSQYCYFTENWGVRQATHQIYSSLPVWV